MAVLPVSAKTNDKAAKELSKDPRALLAAAAPYYDFSSPDLKPWHLKATYQLYDADGKPTEQGTYEYWWASPQVYRSTWTRTGASESDWTTAEGRYVEIGPGDGLDYYEYALKRELLTPLPDADLLQSENSLLASKHVDNGSMEMECVMVMSKHLGIDSIAAIPMGMLPTYCFDAHSRALLASYSFGGLTAQFPQVIRTQGHYLAKMIVLSENGHKVLSASVEALDSAAVSDPAFTPSHDAKSMPPAGLNTADLIHMDYSTIFKTGNLIHQISPVYPEQARQSRVQGTVVLRAIIGKDGNVHGLRVVSAPSALLIGSSIAAVSQWKYKPFLIKGKPVAVETKIRVIYSLSGSTSFDFR